MWPTWPRVKRRMKCDIKSLSAPVQMTSQMTIDDDDFEDDDEGVAVNGWLTSDILNKFIR